MELFLGWLAFVLAIAIVISRASLAKIIVFSWLLVASTFAGGVLMLVTGNEMYLAGLILAGPLIGLVVIGTITATQTFLAAKRSR